MHHRVATRHFKSPELLCAFQYYDYSLDVWSAGAMLAGFMFLRQPFFRGSTNTNQLDKVVEILGSAGFVQLVRKYNLDVNSNRMRELSGYEPRSFKCFINSDNQSLVDSVGIDFLNSLLQYDPEKRPTCQQALQHHWFDEVRVELAKIYAAEVEPIEKHIKCNFKDIPKPCFPSFEYKEGIQYPVPLSPNELAHEHIIDDKRWTEDWTVWQRETNRIGW